MSTHVPAYPKIWTLGGSNTENALTGPVVIQEKVDGSQFAFGVDEQGVLCCRSHRLDIDMDDPPKMFATAVAQVQTMASSISNCRNFYFFAEYLEKPHHNVLSYERTPKGNLVLFDVMVGGTLVNNRHTLTIWADQLGIDVVPELHHGAITLPELRDLQQTPSFLGRETVEGIVIKNYDQSINIYGQIMPVFTKYVREAFKERHGNELAKEKAERGGINAYIQQFATEARWQKAVIHARELGLIERSPKDIGALMKLISEDLEIEESDNIKQELYKLFRKDILKAATRGLPDWYKESLLASLEPEEQAA